MKRSFEIPSGVRDAREAFLAANTSPPPLFKELQDAAFTHLEKNGFPTHKAEKWIYTNVKKAVDAPLKLAAKSEIDLALANWEALPLMNANTLRIVFVDGVLNPALSQMQNLPKGVEIVSLEKAAKNTPEKIEPWLGKIAKNEDNAFVALNSAFLSNGAFVQIAKNAEIKEPLHFVFLSSATQSDTVIFPRLLIIAGESSQTTIVETHAGGSENTYFTNPVTEIEVGPNAKIDHIKVGADSSDARHVGAVVARQARDSVFIQHGVMVGGAFVRNDIAALMVEKGATCNMSGLFTGGKERHIDNQTLADHQQPHCTSTETYKGILTDNARGVFTGYVNVHKDAQKTVSNQLNKNLLLSKGASVNTRPQLEIFADDVKCAHGATVARIEGDALFYLQARGISKKDARHMLMDAFARDSLEAISDKTVREAMQEFGSHTLRELDV